MKSLRQFEKEGLLSLSRNLITINNSDVLNRHACVCAKNTIKIGR
jgi:hypothetical protein